MYEKIQETASWLKERMITGPKTAIILGIGLGQLASEITNSYEFAYTDIPNFLLPMVEGHPGKLIFGKLGGKNITAIQGRLRYYEGYGMKKVTFPERIMYGLGTGILFVSSALRGMNPDFKIGDLTIIDDYINLSPGYPLHGKNFPAGPKSSDMHEAYDGQLRILADKITEEKGTGVVHDIYVGVQGPAFETPAEYRMCYHLGDDAIGMSTISEVIMACHCGIEMFGISIITDLGIEGRPVEVSHEEVQAAANKVWPLTIEIMSETIKRSRRMLTVS